MGPNPYESIWVHMGPHVSIWINMGSYGFIWVHICSYGSMWVHMGPWAHMGPYGSIWVHGQAQAGQAGNGWLGWQKATVASGLDLRLSMNQHRRGHLRCAKLKYNHTAFQNKRRSYEFLLISQLYCRQSYRNPRVAVTFLEKVSSHRSILKTAMARANAKSVSGSFLKHVFSFVIFV